MRGFLSAIAALAWVGSGLAAIGAVLFLKATLPGAQSAPQEASVAAMGLAIAVIPYVFARAIDSFRQIVYEPEIHLTATTKTVQGVEPQG